MPRSVIDTAEWCDTKPGLGPWPSRNGAGYNFDWICKEKIISPLVEELFDGPIDIVGDVHGEIEALRHLLEHLGYNGQGFHPEGRRLVFLGDLVDRGPDSPAVLELVMRLVENKRAQCILGNHELNLLRGDIKEGNNWFTKPQEKGEYPFAPISDQQKKVFIGFLEKLPLILMNSNLRLVHAAWNQHAIDEVLALEPGTGALDAYRHFDQGQLPLISDRSISKAKIDGILKNKKQVPLFMSDLAERETASQMRNPVKILTSGVEAPAPKPFWAGGKWRMVKRVKWWNDYREEVPVIMGHYWRRFGKLPSAMRDKDGPDLFKGVEPHHWLGPNKNVYCVDFSVGLRHKGRVENWPIHLFKLAALRWPEKKIMHDDGMCSDLHND